MDSAESQSRAKYPAICLSSPSPTEFLFI